MSVQTQFDHRPVVLRKQEDAVRITLDQEKRLSDDSLNTLVKESAFNQFVMVWLVFLSVIIAVLTAFTIITYDDVQTLKEFH